MLAFSNAFVPPLRTGLATSKCPARFAIARAPVKKTGLRGLHMVISMDDIDTAIQITGNNMAMTDSLRTYVREKLSKVIRKHASLLTKIDVHLAVEHNPAIAARHKAEVVAFAGKTILRAEVRAVDMYAAIDLVEERVGRTLRKYKERKVGRSRKAGGDKNSDLAAGVPDGGVAPLGLVEEDDDEALNDVYANVGTTNTGIGGVPPVNEIVRRKSFPMPTQSVDEAVLCCEYLDHSWYMFKNAETSKLALVYKRNHGGYGLIEPEE